ncbi:MAG TPA: SMR family transporter [Puia sp.]|nr:SMR family transporter [Puia sp.]
MHWFFLIFSALCDAVYNVFLKRLHSFSDYGNLFFVVIFLAGSVVGFKKGIDGIQLGIAMVVWSGVAIIGTILLDVVIYKAKIDYKIAFFMLLCIVSIVGLNYYSNK